LNRTESAAAWRRSSPLAAIFFLGKIFEAVAKNALQSVAPLAAFIFAADGSIAGNAVIAISVFLAGTVVIAVLRYLFFRYSIGDRSILIRDGILNKKQLDIRFDRIQAINTEQSILFRPFRLVNVRIDTAGSSAQEGYLPAVPEGLADRLEERLQGASPSAAGEGVPEFASADPAQRVFLQYGAGDIVRIGLTSNRALILLAVIAPFLERLVGDRFGDIEAQDLDNAAGRAAEVDPLLVLGAIAFVFLAVALVLILASLVGALLRYHRFVLSSDGRRLRSVGGLLTRHEHSIRFGKIQAVYLYQGILQRLFGVFRLNIRQASSSRQGESGSFVVPLLAAPGLAELARAAFAGEFPDAEIEPRSKGFHAVAPQYLRANLVARGVVPAIAVAAVAAPVLHWGAAVALAWIPLSWLVFLRRYRVLGVRIRDDGVSIRSGFVGVRVAAHLFRKVQRVSLSQSPFQRRHDLATLKLFLASGSLRIPFLKRRDAELLGDYILYRVESDSRAWH